MTLLLAALIGTWAALPAHVRPPFDQPEVPAQVIACDEDAVIVGYGDFEGGYWTDYGCVSADDLR